MFEKAKKAIADNPGEPITKDVYVLYSSDEHGIKKYNEYCQNVSGYKYFQGGHFFINHHVDELAEYIKKCLT